LRELRKSASRHSFSAKKKKKRNKFEKGKLVVLLVFMYQQKNECNGLFLPFYKEINVMIFIEVKQVKTKDNNEQKNI